MPKNAYFLEGCKIAVVPGGSAPESSLASGGWGLRPQTPTLLFTLTDIKKNSRSAYLALKLF